MLIRTLAEAISHYGSDAYLLTVAPDGPHTSPVTMEYRDARIVCPLRASAARNIAHQPNISLLWPAIESGGYALIVNGVADIAQQAETIMASITLSKAVLHRAGPRAEDSNGTCANDCNPLTL